MNCTKCGHTITLNQRICPRCHYFREQDRYVEIAPPTIQQTRKKSQEGIPQVVSEKTLKKLHREATQTKRAPFQLPGKILIRSLDIIFLFGIIPGLVHLYLKQYRQALLYCAGVLGLLLAAFSPWGAATMLGPVCIGLAASLHAYSIFSVSPFRLDENPYMRMGSLVSMLISLVLFIYIPLTTYFARLFPAKWMRLVRNRDYEYFTRDVDFIFFSMVGAFILFCLSFSIGFYFHHRKQHNKEKQ